MLDLDSILKNDTVKNILDKVGVDEKQAKEVAQQAISSIQKKFSQNPKQMSSLLSDNPNTPEDESLKGEVENDFFSGLVEKIGLSSENADKVKSAMPDIMNQFSSKLSESGANNSEGISGMFSGVMDMLDGDMDNDGKKDEGGFLGGLKKKFFGS